MPVVEGKAAVPHGIQWIVMMPSTARHSEGLIRW
jgi:hypothetical protein